MFKRIAHTRIYLIEIFFYSLKKTLQSCIKFKKFNSSSVHGIELSSQLKFSSFDKNWTWTAAQLTIELFWTEFKVNSERVECPLVEKRRNWAFSMSWHTKFCSSFPFLVGGTPLSLNWLWTQFKKVQWWVEQQFKFSFWSMNWIWIDHQVQGKNWIELRTSIQFWTAIQLCMDLTFQEQCLAPNMFCNILVSKKIGNSFAPLFSSL